MITRPDLAAAGAGCGMGDDLRRVGSKTSTRPKAGSGLIASEGFALAPPAHSVTAAATRTKTGKQAAQKTDERAIVRTLRVDRRNGASVGRRVC